MHAITAAVGFVATVLYGHRAGVLYASLDRYEKAARGGIGLVLATVTVGFFRRALMHADFDWVHWMVLIALVTTCAGYIGLLAGHRRKP